MIESSSLDQREKERNDLATQRISRDKNLSRTKRLERTIPLRRTIQLSPREERCCCYCSSVPLTCPQPRQRETRRIERERGGAVCSCDVVGASARASWSARGTKPKRARSGRSRRTIRRARSHRVTHARPPRFVVTVKAHAKH